MNSKRKFLLLLSATLATSLVSVAADAPRHSDRPKAKLLVSGLASRSGSTIGPDGALYVTEAATGRVLRVNPRNGHVSTFATGLPQRIVGTGGAMDIAFIGRRAYVIVTLVGPDVGGGDVVGLYQVDNNGVSVVADIGAFALAHPPSTPFFVPTGVQYAMQPYRGNFLVTDGHHNRVLYVKRDGDVSEVIAFPNIVPTGLELLGSLVFVAQAGPVPHLPQNGRIVALGPLAEGSNPSGCRRTTSRRRRVRPPSHALRSGTGFFHPRKSRGLPGESEYRFPREGQAGRQLRRGGQRSGPSDVPRIHRGHCLHRHAGWGDLVDRQRCPDGETDAPPTGTRVSPALLSLVKNRESRRGHGKEDLGRDRLSPLVHVNPRDVVQHRRLLRGS